MTELKIISEIKTYIVIILYQFYVVILIFNISNIIIVFFFSNNCELINCISNSQYYNILKRWTLLVYNITCAACIPLLKWYNIICLSNIVYKILKSSILLIHTVWRLRYAKQMITLYI